MRTAFSLSLCTGAALLISMILSSVSGTVVPIFFKKLGIDPAVASGPLITTINDLVAVVTQEGLTRDLPPGVVDPVPFTPASTAKLGENID